MLILTDEEIEALSNGLDISESKSILSFKDYISEANYGVLENDERYERLKKAFIKNVKQVISENPNEISFKGVILDIPIMKKYKESGFAKIALGWKINTGIAKPISSGICLGAGIISLGNNIFSLELTCSMTAGTKLRVYQNELLFFFRK